MKNTGVLQIYNRIKCRHTHPHSGWRGAEYMLSDRSIIWVPERRLILSEKYMYLLGDSLKDIDIPGLFHRLLNADNFWDFLFVLLYAWLSTLNNNKKKIISVEKTPMKKKKKKEINNNNNEAKYVWQFPPLHVYPLPWKGITTRGKSEKMISVFFIIV